MTKPHFRIRSDGWIVHDGGECPVPPRTRVFIEVITNKDGEVDRDWPVVRADAWTSKCNDWWSGAGAPPFRISAFRVVQEDRIYG